MAPNPNPNPNPFSTAGPCMRALPQVQEYRWRMVEARVGDELTKVVRDPNYDAKTKAAAGALW